MWSRKYDKCIVCGTTERKYCAKGVCARCYSRTPKSKLYQKDYQQSLEYKAKRKIYRQSPKVKLRQKKYLKIYGQLPRVKERKKIHRQSLEGKAMENKRVKERLKTDFHFKIKCNLSTLIGNRLRQRISSKKGKSTFDILPYTIEELIFHLEKLFTVGMTWDNYGYWHIDHKIPDIHFNYVNTEDEEFQKSWALSNLQPLWEKDNLSKGSKIIN